MFEFLVIDDDSTRVNSYKQAFAYLNLDYAFSKKDFVEKIKKTYDGYIVDVIFTEETFEELNFSGIIKALPEKKPLFIISENWQTAMDSMKMKALISNKSKYNQVLGYLSWNQIKEENEYAKDFIQGQIQNYFNLAYNAFAPDDDIIILQISDIEFGNPQQEEFIESRRESLLGEVRTGLRNLGIEKNRVDFICICGDTAYYGKEEEYDKAKVWLRKLGEELLVNADFSNMLIVPGNHDFCYDAAAGNYFEYDKDKKDYLKRDKMASPSFLAHGMYNFAKFVYELTGEISYMLDPYQPIIKHTYRDYDLGFILLNPVKVDFDKNFKYGLSDEHTQYLLRYANENNTEICNIVLSHFHPDRYHQIDRSADVANRTVKDVIDNLHVKGWFYGHAHDEQFIDDQRVASKKILLSRTQSLMLKNPGVNDGAKNGFTILRLHRENNKIIKIGYFDGEKEKCYRSPFED